MSRYGRNGIKERPNRYPVRNKKWEWVLEPRYWRNTLTLGRISFSLFQGMAYFVSPGLINTMISANIYAAIAMPLALMTIGTGRMNFGPQFYIGVGGYTAALLSIAYGWGPLTTLPFAILLSIIRRFYSALWSSWREVFTMFSSHCFCRWFFWK